MMRATHICLLSVLLAALYTSGAADDGWKGGRDGDHHDGHHGGDRYDGDHHDGGHHDGGRHHDGDRYHGDHDLASHAEADSSRKHEKKYINIYGKITWKRRGVKGVKVYAYDHSKMGKNVHLGHAYTDEYGRYKIRYSLEKHHKQHKYPNVFIQVKYKGKTKRSRVYYNVRNDVKIDLGL